MAYFEFIWSKELIAHVDEHDVACDDFEYIVCDPVERGWSRTSGLPAAWGYAPDGRYIMAIYELIDDITIFPSLHLKFPNQDILHTDVI